MPPKKKAVKGVAGGKGNGGNTSATLAAAQMETPAVVERPMSTTPSAITSTIYEHNENRGIEQAFNHHGKKATGKARFQEGQCSLFIIKSSCASNSQRASFHLLTALSYSLFMSPARALFTATQHIHYFHLITPTPNHLTLTTSPGQRAR